MQWANISGEYLDVEDFIPLCIFHHRRYDRRKKEASWKTCPAS